MRAMLADQRGSGLGAVLVESCRRPGVLACALVLLTLLAYRPALDAGFLAFDDDLYVTKEHRLESLDGLRRIWTDVAGPGYRHQYYPMTSTVFWLQHQVWGNHPFGYHLVNVLLHAANAVLLWRLLVLLGIPGGWLAAAVFAVHPVHVQSVAWVAELKNVLSTSFFLLSLHAFVRWLGLSESAPDGCHASPAEGGRGMLYALGFALFLCALLSKTATCLLPVALLLLAWFKRDRIDRRVFLAVVPVAVVGLTFVGLTVYLEAHHGGARGELYNQSWLERCLIAGRALWFYAGKLVWPVGFSFVYPRWEIAASWWLYGAAAAMVVVGLWVLRHRIGKAPVAAVGYFVVALVPVSFVNVGFARLSFVADHWQYWASMGLIVLVVGAVAHHTCSWREPWMRVWARATAVVIVAGFAFLTWQRAKVFESPRTLWYDTVVRNPDAWVAQNNLGAALARAGHLEAAMVHYRAALRLRPGYAHVRTNLGNALHVLNRSEEAIEHLETAASLRPGMAEAHFNLASALYDVGRCDEAMESFRRVLQINSDDALAHNGLGTVLMAEGRYADAISSFRSALESNPRLRPATRNLQVAATRLVEEKASGRVFRNRAAGAPPEPRRKTLPEAFSSEPDADSQREAGGGGGVAEHGLDT